MDLKTTIQKIIELAGFGDFSVDYDKENRKVSIFINEGDWLKDWLPSLVTNFSHLIKLLAKKAGEENVFIDINNYRREREQIIVDLARAAARKVLISRTEVKLPAMNAYERRLIHVELSTRPDVKTESQGEGTERCVIVKPLE